MTKAANDLGYQIEDWGLYLDDGSYLGRATEVKLPDLVRKTEDHTPGGALGELAIDTGVYQKLEFELTLTDISSILTTKVKQNKISEHKIELRAMARNDLTGDKKSVRITMGGRINEISRENFKTGEISSLTLKGAATSYEESFGGKIVRHLDLLNRIDSVNGFDSKEQNRNFIG